MILISRNGDVIGEYDASQILDEMAKGVILASDWLWAEGMSEWTPVESYLASVTPTPNSPRPKKKAEEKAPSTDWRTAPATENQLNYLSNLGVNVKSPLTKGDASELIDRHKDTPKAKAFQEAKWAAEEEAGRIHRSNYPSHAMLKDIEEFRPEIEKLKKELETKPLEIRELKAEIENTKAEIEQVKGDETLNEDDRQDHLTDMRDDLECMKEEEKAEREFEKAIKQAEKEEAMLNRALEQARAEMQKANDQERLILQGQLSEIEEKLREAEEKNQRALSMAQQTKRGHVYIISNIGSFGDDVFKIGMTRRLEPMDRVKELGDASVPFRFDVHALIFCEDAPKLEAELHKFFESRRVNKVNHRKEFFRVSITEIREIMSKQGIEGIRWTLESEAREFRETLALSHA